MKKLAEDNQKLIAENSEKLAEIQRLVNELKDKEIANLETIAQNTQDIASNASLIAKNAASIQSNAAAIAQNASDIQALQRKLDATKTELVEAYTAAIAKAINDYDGTITAKLASEIAKVEDKIKTLSSEIESIKSRLSNLEDRVSKIENILTRVTSISYIPSNSDKVEYVDLWRDDSSSDYVSIGLTDLVLYFQMYPYEAVDDVVTHATSAIKVKAHYTDIRTKGNGAYCDVALSVRYINSYSDGVIRVVISTDELDKGFIMGEKGVAVAIIIPYTDTPVVSEYVNVAISQSELKFNRRLLKDYFYDVGYDGNGKKILDLNTMKKTTELYVSGMGIGNINGVVGKMSRLEVLDCSDNDLYSLDLSNNPRLKELYCKNNSLMELDLTLNENVSIVDFRGNYFNNCFNDFKQAGFLINNTRWSIINTGAYASFDLGETHSVGMDDPGPLCPDGWRLPTADELESLFTSHSELMKLKEFLGWWMGGKSKTNAVFFPFDTELIEPTYSSYLSSASEGGTYKSLTYSRDSAGNLICRMQESPYGVAGSARCVKE